MDSCTTTVKVRKIMGFKNIRKGLIPLLLWPVLMIASLICLRFTQFAVLVMLLVKHQKGTVVTRFAGIIEEPFADDFMRFLKENEVEVLDSNSGKRI